jgi:hypothetical protein
MCALPTMSVMFTTLLVSLGSVAADPLTVKWDDVIGVIQAGNQVGSGTGRITGGGQPWSTQGGKAQVDLRTGRVKFTVKGLVLAGGNTIGTPGTVTMVKGTLVCDTNGSAGGGNSVLVDTELVPLSAQGDADFSGDVTLAAVCQTESDLAFVIRTGSGAWIANGSVRTP